MIAISQGISSTEGVKRSLRYVSRDGAITFTSNLLSQANDIDAIEQEYLDNLQYLNINARGKNLIFSETLSLPIDVNMDRDKQIKILKELIFVHTNNRELQDHLGFFAIHNDQKHLHAHCIYSANERMGVKRHRVSKKEFLNSQRALENYRNKNYPQLKQTHHYSNKLERRIKLSESRIRHLRKTITKKEIVLRKLKKSMCKSNQAEFHASLKEQDLVLYERGKKTIGLHDLKEGRNYRLNTLQKNLTEEYLAYKKSLQVSKAISKKQTQAPKKTKPVTKPKVTPPPVQKIASKKNEITPTPSQTIRKKYGR